MEKNADINFEQEVVIDDSAIAPITKGQVLGRVNFKVDGEIMAGCDLVACENVGKIGVFTMGNEILWKWFCLFRGE